MLYTHKSIPNLNPPLLESVWPLGKYKGQLFAVAPENYQRWAYVYQKAFCRPFVNRVDVLLEYLEKTRNPAKRQAMEQDLEKARRELEAVELFFDKFNRWVKREKAWGNPSDREEFPPNKKSIKQIINKRYPKEALPK